ncbi:MAG: lipoyl(octanoyl) transferase LipB [Gammaproteobacteria bacterium]|nr:lipoyl(octanoyl) transferase LipB [Gammaproteobacteria bacterium]
MPSHLTCRVQHLGRVGYETTFERMRAFTDARDADTLDEFWLLEHPPVYTVGVRAHKRAFNTGNDIPFALTDRGGDVTYHGPGQPILYVLIDLNRRGLGIRALVQMLEEAVIAMLAKLGIDAEWHAGAPGVYVAGRKIASLGMRVRAGRSYHGLALNADMDLSPFKAIDPCGYPGLEVTQLADLISGIGSAAAGARLLAQVLERLGYTPAHA